MGFLSGVASIHHPGSLPYHPFPSHLRWCHHPFHPGQSKRGPDLFHFWCFSDCFNEEKAEISDDPIRLGDYKGALSSGLSVSSTRNVEKLGVSFKECNQRPLLDQKSMQMRSFYYVLFFHVSMGMELILEEKLPRKW